MILSLLDADLGRSERVGAVGNLTGAYTLDSVGLVGEDGSDGVVEQDPFRPDPTLLLAFCLSVHVYL